MKLSIVLPTFNESIWLPETLSALDAALSISGIQNSEIIIIDDGSTDDIKNTLGSLNLNTKINYIYQKNSGRFLARKKGIEAAKYEYVLFIDSRVHIHKNSLKFIVSQIKKHPDHNVWNAHVDVNKNKNVFARFWDVITCIAWRKYFSKPRHISYGLDEFDLYPKGTTCFLTKKSILQEAMAAFSTLSVDMKKANDDTLLIKNIAAKNSINIAPSFSCTYFARSSFKKFLSHAYHRGQVFVDGFLRPGNRFFYPLVAFLLMSTVLLGMFVMMPMLTLFIPVLAVCFSFVCFILSRIARIPAISLKDSLWFSLLSVPFAIVYGAGIWKAVISKMLNGSLLGSRLAKRYAWLLMTLVVYSVLTVYYMHPVISSCKTTVLAQGDATSGLIARTELVPNNPMWGYTKSLSQPYGEDLNQPVNWSAPAFYATYWMSSKVVGPVCGLNLMNAGGYVISATIMCVFVYWLIRQKWIAMLSGYAVSFTPYFQHKIGGHPSYGYQAILITLFWLTILVWQRREKKYIALLGINSAVLAYWDAYFVLLGGVLIAGVVFGMVIHGILGRQSIKGIWPVLKRYTLAAILAGILILPLAFIRVKYTSQINSIMGGGRGDIAFEAHAYSNRPIEYMLPTDTHPIINKLFGEGYQKISRHYSNPGEYTVGLSLALLTVIGLFFIIVMWERLTKGKVWPRKSNLKTPFGALMVVLISVVVLAFLVALPPRYGPFYNPSYFIIKLITMWRVFSRLYVVINIGIVCLAALALYYFSLSLKQTKIKWLVATLLSLLIFFEYQAFYPGRHHWSYANSVPSIYYRLAERSDINAIAEYPLDERDALGLRNNYITYQRIHDKSLLNGILANTDAEAIRRGLADLTDAQTIPVLRALGIDAVMLHGPKAAERIEGLELIDSHLPTYTPSSKLEPVFLYRILPGPVAEFSLIPKGEDIELQYDAEGIRNQYVFRESLGIETRMFNNSSKISPICIVLKATGDKPIDITVKTDQVTQNLSISNQPKKVSYTTRELEFVANTDNAQVIVSEFGCTN